MRKDKTTPAQKRGQPRRRVVPWWRRRLALTAWALLVLAGLAAGGWWSWQQRWPQTMASEMRAAAVDASIDLGFTVEEVFVVGRRETSRASLLEALAVSRGAAILDFDIHAARERLLALPWVQTASIERLLPDTVVVEITERRPLALWQHHGDFSLIDEDGAVILRRNLEPFSDLLVVVGEDAPAHAADLIRTLGTQPELMPLVQAAVRVGGRRWNLRIAGGIDVRLPEEDPSGAWEKLAEYQRLHGLLRKDVKVLDLRLPDRLIVRRVARPENQDTASGRDT
jgi:cell division protein FtsQ